MTLREQYPREYHTWTNMRLRCNNPEHKAFADYGGRGITVSPEWDTFEAFFRDLGPKPAGYTLERKDNNKGYSPSNCCWATRAEQARNTRKRKTGKAVVRGVTYMRDCARWRVQIQHQRKNRHIGLFGNLLDAVAARYRAEREIWPAPCADSVSITQTATVQ